MPSATAKHLSTSSSTPAHTGTSAASTNGDHHPQATKTMLALKKAQPAPGLTLSPRTPVPTIGPREVLIAVTHAGICGTDRHIYEWDEWSANRVPVGTTTGHEFVGKVVAIGNGVERTKVGERVSAEGHIGCGVC